MTDQEKIYELVKLNSELIDASYDHDLRNANVRLADKLWGIKHLVCDLIMYRDDINNAPCRFQDVIDRLIAEVVDADGVINL